MLRVRIVDDTAYVAVFAVVSMAAVRPAHAQAVPSGDKGGFTVVAGAATSGYEVQYGRQNLLGVTATVDADARRRIGLEGEARWLMFHQTDGLHETTWMAGPRYHCSRGKLQIYAKGLIGFGQLVFPHNYARGDYLAIAPGAGIYYRWKRRISFRLADFEYQYWPQFTYGPLASYGLSSGVRAHIF
jgi:hypothetical protein